MRTDKKYIKICPIDNRPCDIKILPHDIGKWVSGKCRQGGFSEEDATFPECEKHLHNRRFNLEDNDVDRKKKPSKAKPKRKICKCKK
jgi:hypothetical protein